MPLFTQLVCGSCCSVAQLCLTLCDPHGLQHAGLPCPSLSLGVCSNSCPLSWWRACFKSRFNLGHAEGGRLFLSPALHRDCDQAMLLLCSPILQHPSAQPVPRAAPPLSQRGPHCPLFRPDWAHSAVSCPDVDPSSISPRSQPSVSCHSPAWCDLERCLICLRYECCLF